MQGVTTKDKEWKWVVQRVIASGAMNDKEGQCFVILANFPLFLIREEPTTKHPKENS